jgi:hypothetical protein
MTTLENEAVVDQAAESKRTEKAPRRRLWLRFSLRAAIVVQVGLCVWLAIVANAARRQKAAVERVQELGGFVYYDYQITHNGGVDYDALPWAPGWLSDALGDDLFRTAVFVVFTFDYLGAETTIQPLFDADLAVLGELPHIHTLSLSGRRNITDDGLRHLSSLTHLQILTLNATDVQGSELAHVAEMPKLRWLVLHDTQIGDSGLETLSASASLEAISLDKTRVTDEGLKHLAKIKTLMTVGTSGTQVTEAGRAELRRALPNCEVK